MKNSKFINKILNEDCVKILKKIPKDSIDLVITSPPYDNLRSYKGYKFKFEMNLFYGKRTDFPINKV